MPAPTERRCICGHAEATHVFCVDEIGNNDGNICAKEGCPCMEFYLWEVVLESPRAERYRVTDCAKFVRDNPDLFDWEDREARPDASKKNGLCHKWVFAETGLSAIITKRQEQWKGWSVVMFPKTFRKNLGASGKPEGGKLESGRERLIEPAGQPANPEAEVSAESVICARACEYGHVYAAGNRDRDSSGS